MTRGAVAGKREEEEHEHTRRHRPWDPLSTVAIYNKVIGRVNYFLFLYKLLWKKGVLELLILLTTSIILELFTFLSQRYWWIK